MKLAALLTLTCFASTLASRRANGDVNALTELLHGCKCVKFYFCDDDNNITPNGKRILRLRRDLPKRIPCTGGSFPGEVICCKVSNAQAQNLEKSASNQMCGISNKRVNGGFLAPEDSEFPWLAAIYVKSSTGAFEFRCTGSLIHPKVVLTASHCIGPNKPDGFKVVANGRTNCSLANSLHTEKSGVSEIVNHPNYNSGSRHNDVGLLILEKSFTFGGQGLINALCLPPNRMELEGSECIVASWAKDYFGQGARILQKATVSSVSHDRCQVLLRNTVLGPNFNLDESFTCAADEEGRGASAGSGGSPLMCRTPSWSNQYSQVGLMSWGLEWGAKDVPKVYTSVHHVTQWINSELQNRSLNLT